jgi:hypothetical protein
MDVGSELPQNITCQYSFEENKFTEIFQPVPQKIKSCQILVKSLVIKICRLLKPK